MISNPSNPSTEEIEEWAYSNDDEPDQEWELFLIWKADFELYLKYASDVSCPKEEFFLNLLYYWVWRNVRHDSIENELESYERIFQLAEKINTPYVRIWSVRSKELIVNNAVYSAEQWLAGRRPYDVQP
ncbi:hypothetical protein [Teredinibacter purpureus]|uniref:hypothetical protein n=1 Tax=Teredinibacter purpureus TaxID=2731756 RepID=UPI000695D63A|nr:hypothetical protein [Teredinibacter purpureus]